MTNLLVAVTTYITVPRVGKGVAAGTRGFTWSAFEPA
jgi:hypothetical protein